MTTAVSSSTVKLGLVLSACAALCAVVLASIGDVSTWSLVLSVALVGFVASWVQTTRAPRIQRRPIVLVDHRMHHSVG